MQAIILAGGYAKRLWPLTITQPKPLLPVEGKPVVAYVIDRVDELGDRVNGIMILTNHTFRSDFEKVLPTWGRADIHVVDDGSSSEETKIGAIGALGKIADMIAGDFLVLAGDCLFRDSLTGMLSLYDRVRAPVVALYPPENEDQMLRGSYAAISGEGIVTQYVERPSSARPGLVGAVIYSFPRSIVNRIVEYLDLGLPKDEPGRFVEWLHKKERLHGYVFASDVWDIGTAEAYGKASEYLRSTA